MPFAHQICRSITRSSKIYIYAYLFPTCSYPSFLFIPITIVSHPSFLSSAYTIFRKIRKYQRMTSPKTSSNSSSTASPTTPTTRTAQLAYAIHLFKTHIASPTNTIPQEAIALPDGMYLSIFIYILYAHSISPLSRVVLYSYLFLSPFFSLHFLHINPATIRSISSTLLSCTPSLFADLERVCIQILEYVFKRGFVSSGAYHMYERAVSLPDNVKQLLLETRVRIIFFTCLIIILIYRAYLISTSNLH